jgi:hypothetical protein
MRIVSLQVQETFILPQDAIPAQAVEGAVIWDSTEKFLTIHNGTIIKTYVDTNSSQAITNKTYEGLTIDATTFTLDLNANLTINAGSVTINADAGGSILTLPPISTISALTATHALYASANNTIAGEAQLDEIRGGTGHGTYAVGDILIADSTSSLKRKPIGNARQFLLVNEAGTDVIYRTVEGDGTNVIVSLDGETIRVSSVQNLAPGSSVTFEDLSLSGDLAVNGGDITSISPTFNFLNTQSVALTTLASGNSSLTVGTDDALVRSTQLHTSLQVGSAINNRPSTFYGDIYHETGDFFFGGASGFKIEWNAVDESFDFIKL